MITWIWNQNIAISTIVGTSSLWNQNIAISTIVGTLSHIKAYHNTNILQLSLTITQIVIILLKFNQYMVKSAENRMRSNPGTTSGY
jgi:hypothetical protein